MNPSPGQLENRGTTELLCMNPSVPSKHRPQRGDADRGDLGVTTARDHPEERDPRLLVFRELIPRSRCGHGHGDGATIHLPKTPRSVAQERAVILGSVFSGTSPSSASQPRSFSVAGVPKFTRACRSDCCGPMSARRTWRFLAAHISRREGLKGDRCRQCGEVQNKGGMHLSGRKPTCLRQRRDLSLRPFRAIKCGTMQLGSIGIPNNRQGYLAISGQMLRRIFTPAFHGEQPSRSQVVDLIDTNVPLPTLCQRRNVSGPQNPEFAARPVVHAFCRALVGSQTGSACSVSARRSPRMTTSKPSVRPGST